MSSQYYQDSAPPDTGGRKQDQEISDEKLLLPVFEKEELCKWHTSKSDFIPGKASKIEY